MEREEIIEKLNNYLIIQAKIKSLERDIKELERYSISLGNSIGDGMPHGSSSNDAKYARTVEKMVDITAQNREEIKSLIKERKECVDLINKCKNRKQRYILELHYISGWSIKRISNEIGKSDRNVQYLISRGIDSIAG